MKINMNGKKISLSGQASEAFQRGMGYEVTESDAGVFIGAKYHKTFSEVLSSVSEKDLSLTVEQGIFDEIVGIGGEDGKKLWDSCEKFGKSEIQSASWE